MMLNKAIQSFDPSRNKSFTRYFELILKRQLYKMKNALPGYCLYETTDFCTGVSYIEEEVELPNFTSNLEAEIHDLYFLKRHSISKISRDRNNFV